MTKSSLQRTIAALIVIVSLISTPDGKAQSPEAIHPGITIESALSAVGTPVRLGYDQSSGDLYFLTINGDIYRVRPPFSNLNSERVYTASDHGISSNTLGFLVTPDGTLFVVGSRPEGSNNRGVIVRGTPDGGGSHTWETVAETVLYETSATPFDHNFNGIALSPDGTTLFVNSGSRTDHGEIQANNNQYPGVREVPLTSAIFRIPADAKDLVLPADEQSLRDQGFWFADGFRNSFDLAFDAAGNLFATENSGDRSDSEELNWVREDRHYGFPWRMGTNDTPQQSQPYNPTFDRLLPPTAFAVVNGFFNNDPTYPARPAGSFTDPVENMGPDADRYQDDRTGVILDASDRGESIGTFTAHRSPLGLVFDTTGELPGPFSRKAFVLSWTGPNDQLLGPFGDEGGDMLMMDLSQEGDNFQSVTTRIIKQFSNPIDAVQIGTDIYVLEMGGGRNIWRVSFSGATSVESLTEPTAVLRMNVYPNPSNGNSILRVDMNSPGDLNVAIYDVLGREVAVAYSGGVRSAGNQTINLSSFSFPPGMYLIRASSGASSRSLKWTVHS